MFQAVGSVIGIVTGPEIDGWYRGLEKSSLNPPDFVFPVAWTILYVLIALTGWRLWERRNALKWQWAAFVVYVAFNWSWSFVFFSFKQTGSALVWIMVINLLSLALIIGCWRRDRPVALLMVLPLLWTCFATWLNYQIWVLN